MAIAGDLLASGATMQCNVPAKGWNAGAVMADASLNRRQTIRVGAIVAFAQVGIVGFDGQIELEAEVPLDRPRRAPGATALTDVTVSRARAGDLATASLMSSTRFIELDAAVWSNNTGRVMARNISGATFDLAAATLSVGGGRGKAARAETMRSQGGRPYPLSIPRSQPSRSAVAASASRSTSR